MLRRSRSFGMVNQSLVLRINICGENRQLLEQMLLSLMDLQFDVSKSNDYNDKL